MFNAPTHILAEGDYGEMFFWCLMIIALLVGGFFAVSWVRRWAKQDDGPPPGGFMLSDLRQLHKSGKMTDEEFERAKAMMIEATKAAAARKESTNPKSSAKRLDGIL